MPANNLSEGQHIIKLAANDSAGAISTASVTIKVYRIAPPTGNKPPVLNDPSDQSVQYSDLLSFIVSATDPNNPGSELTFSASGLPAGLTITDNLDGTASVSGIITTAPGSYNTSITVTDPNGLSDTKSVLITVEKEDARTIYTGPSLVSTGCRSCSTATIPLRATILDITAVLADPSYDPDAGDITNATVTFVNRDQGDAVLCSANIVLLDPTDPKTGSATCDWTTNLDSNDGVIYTVGILVNGYYTQDSTTEDTIVTISKPTSNYIQGGGYVINQNSRGTYAGDPGLKTHFGFYVNLNMQGTRLLGKVNIIVRQNGNVYLFKSSDLSSLYIVKSKNDIASAELIGKANIYDITDRKNPIKLVDRATIDLTLKDFGEPHAVNGDTIGITVWDKNGSLLYSSNWTGVKTVEQTLDGGNIQIHLDSSMATPIKFEQWYEIFVPVMQRD